MLLTAEQGGSIDSEKSDIDAWCLFDMKNILQVQLKILQIFISVVVWLAH